MKASKLVLAIGALALLLAACGGGGEPSASSTAAPRPASSAKLDILEPAAGASVSGGAVTVRLSLEGARIVEEATKELKADEGHVHLTMNDQLQSMTFALEERIPVTPGTHILVAEFVAGDHAPFNPRVIVTRTFTVPAP